MKKLILFLALIFVFIGCKTIHDVQYVDRVHDTIVNVVVKDTLIKYLPQKQSVITAKNSYLHTDLAFSFASIDSLGKLHHSIENEGTIPSKVITNYTKITYTIVKTYTITKTTIEYKTKYATRWFSWVDWIIVGLTFLGGLFWVAKKFKFI